MDKVKSISFDDDNEWEWFKEQLFVHGSCFEVPSSWYCSRDWTHEGKTYENCILYTLGTPADNKHFLKRSIITLHDIFVDFLGCKVALPWQELNLLPPRIPWFVPDNVGTKNIYQVMRCWDLRKGTGAMAVGRKSRSYDSWLYQKIDLLWMSV